MPRPRSISIPFVILTMLLVLLSIATTPLPVQCFGGLSPALVSHPSSPLPESASSSSSSLFLANVGGAVPRPQHQRGDDGVGSVGGDEHDKDDNLSRNRRKLHESRRRDWIDRSVRYYSTVRRISARSRTEFEAADTCSVDAEEEESSDSCTPAQALEEENRKEFVELATKHYYALRKIKTGELRHAERIYRNVIDKTVRFREREGHCDHAVLAASTLLLALLKQRMGDVRGTRSVFVNFFRIVGEDDLRTCTCSAKVLQAFALFEMKRGHGRKGLFLAHRAVSMDGNLAPVLEWKQFRDVVRSVEEKRSAERGGAETPRRGP